MRKRQHPLEMALAEAHDGAHQRRQRPRADQDRLERLLAAQRAREHGPVDAGECVEPELAHRRRQQQADRGGGHRVGVREPEVEGHHRRLHEEADRHQRERHHDEPVGRLPGERVPDLGHVERPGAPVEQRDAGEYQEGADAVRDREVEGSLERPLLLDVVGHERVRRHAQDLEEDEQVEQIARVAEAQHRGEEHEHQSMEERPDHHEIAPAEDEGREEQNRGEQCEASTYLVDRERDPERRAVARGPAPEPVDERAVRRFVEHEHAQHHAGDRGCARQHVDHPARDDRRDRQKHARREQRDRHRDRRQITHARAFAPDGAREGRACRSACGPGRSAPAAVR
jgi:hypothetical protein